MNVYPIITTLALAESLAFYRTALDARVLFESDWYVHLAIGNTELGFLRPNPPHKLPVFQHARPSQGLCLAIEVPDVQKIHAQLVQRKIEILGNPEQFPNGEWAFSVLDPAGTILNFVERSAESSDMIEL